MTINSEQNTYNSEAEHEIRVFHSNSNSEVYTYYKNDGWTLLHFSRNEKPTLGIPDAKW